MRDVRIWLLLFFSVGVLAVMSKKGFWKIDPRGNQYDAAFTAAEKTYQLPAGLLRRMAYQESRFNPDAVSPVGAVGLMQFMPATAKEFNIDSRNAAQSINAAGKYMAQLYKITGSWTKALAAYNWGVGNVQRKGMEKAPAETVAYAAMAADIGVA